MEFLKNLLDGFKELVMSEQVLGLITSSSFATLIINFFINKAQKAKFKIKEIEQTKEIKAIKEAYDKYVTNAETTVVELSKKYIEVAKLAESLVENAKNQNKALETAFKNSNLNASAKELVESYLKRTELIEVEEVTEIPVEPQTETVEEEVEVKQNEKIVRIK